MFQHVLATSEKAERMKQLGFITGAESSSESSGGGLLSTAFSYLRRAGSVGGILNSARTKLITGDTSGKMQHDVEQRQENVLPILKEQLNLTQGVLTNCRKGSKAAFDAIK